jgi:hypothetical protein
LPRWTLMTIRISVGRIRPTMRARRCRRDREPAAAGGRVLATWAPRADPDGQVDIAPCPSPIGTACLESDCQRASSLIERIGLDTTGNAVRRHFRWRHFRLSDDLAPVQRAIAAPLTYAAPGVEMERETTLEKGGI